MSEQVATTVLGTVLGGLLAIVGGFLASMFSQRLARDEEKRTVVREKCEKVYKFTTEVKDWSAEQRAIVVARSSGKDAGTGTPFQLENRASDVVMLVRLYMPALVADAEALRASSEELSLLCDELDAGGSNARAEDATRAVALDRAVADVSKRLRSKLETLIQF